ncbi:unnamed protein product [Cunninghamella echinulata]
MNFLSYFLSKTPKDWNIRGFVDDVLSNRALTSEQITTMFQDSLDLLIKTPTLYTTSRKRARELRDTKVNTKSNNNDNKDNKIKVIMEPDPLSIFNEKFNGADIMDINNISLTLNKDGKAYIIRTPSTKLPSPNKPKIEVANQESLKEFCIIGNRYITTDKDEDNMTVYKEYESNLQDQGKKPSLRSIPGVISFLTDVLEQKMYHFIEWIANYKLAPPSISDNHHHHYQQQQQQQQFVSIMKYALIDFHCNCQ